MRAVLAAPALDALRRRPAALPQAARRGADAALTAVGAVVVAEARHRLGSRLEDGPLARSLTASLEADAPRLVVRATHPAAVFLEYGTRRMAARPFLRPAVAATADVARAASRVALAKALADPEAPP